MIRALNYPEGISVPIILDLAFEDTEEPGHAEKHVGGHRV